MDSSDEEGEIVAECVTNYHFTNNVEELVSFTILPLKWSKDENQGDFETPVFLLGSADDDGLQKIHKLVNAWRFELSYAQPEIFVLYKNKNWLALQKPRKSFEKRIRTILTTIHFLHFVKKNPEASGNSVWTYLFHALSSFEVQPSERDLLDHIPLISEAVKRDTDLAKSKYLLTYMENPFTNRAFNEDMQTMKKLKFIADIDDDYEDDSGGKSEDKNDGFTPYDHVCAICDNGGEILCCEGRCMRSFHANKEAGADSFCESLGLKDAQIKALSTFLCKNCKYQQHQCFACGKLGSSDKSSGAEVFACASATCVHFYHPECVANLLHPANENQAEKLQDKIAAGESFTCPAHKCFYCKEGENKRKHEMQFAICRRCPKAYHRKCLPRSITFECNYAQNIIPRAWDGLLPNRILIYCMDHKIIRELGTPVRNHLKFPGVELRKKIHSPELLSRREKGVASMKSKVYGTLTSKRTVVKSQGHIEKVWGSSVNIGGSTKKIQKRCGPDLDSFRKPNTIDAGSNPPKDNVRSAPYCSLKTTGSKLFMGNYNSSGRLETCPHKFKQKKLASGIQKKTKEEPVVDMASSSRFSVDAKMESRIMALMEKATSSFNSEEFLKSKKHLAGNALLLENLSDRTITMGKVEGSVQAIRTALSILDEGGSIEDAKAVCEPDILSQIFKWKRKLNVYLSPFLHGMRYTSFGRHFTKLKKLEEIVKRLHWYMQDGDTLVDFCCGSNDFSCLMKEKLEKTGKHCKFKNYDLIVPKNDFNFEKRDWMTVNLEELPNGSQLIMGLNPPFGVKAYLANKFISKALEFKPKLLILIVPRETKLLDPNTYKLIWKDEVLLSGKSFYLPGSVDANDKQLDNWNKKPPPLYIWSRRDWSDRHMAIAQEYGHIINKQNQELQEGNYVRNCLRKKNHDSKWDDYSFYDSGDISGILDSIPEHMVEAEPQGAGAIVHEKVTESSFPMDWKNNLGRMEEQPSDIDGFGIDVELSTPSPTNSPPLYTADQHHTAPYMAYEAQHFASSSFLPGVYHYQNPMVSGSGNYTASGPQSQNLHNP